MKTYFSIATFVYVFSYWICHGAEPQIQRQAWTTNSPGAHDAFGTNCTHTNLYTLGRIYAAGPLGTNQVIVGHQAGIIGSNSVGIGYQAGMAISNGNSAVVVGRGAGMYATNAVNATIIGGWAAQRAMHASNATVVGAYAGWMATNIENATLIGRSSGIYATNAPYATMLGARSGADVVNAPYATFIGYAADSSVGPSNIQRSVAIGYEAKVTNTNQFILGTGQYVGINTNAPYAQLHVNGSSLINGSITNTGNIYMLGTSNQIRMANNQGIISYDQSDDVFWLSNAFNGTSLSLGSDIYSSWGSRFSGNGSGLTNVPGSSITGLLSTVTINGLTATNLRVYPSDAYNLPFMVFTNPSYPALVVNSNGYVGVGTNYPSAKLTVKDNVANSDAAAIDIANDARTYRLKIATAEPTNDVFQIADMTAGTVPFWMDDGQANSTLCLSNNAVGIGMLPFTTYKLSVSGGGYFTTYVYGLNGLICGSTYALEWPGRSKLKSALDGVVSLISGPDTNFTRLVFGTNSFATNVLNRYASLSISNRLNDLTPIMSVTAQDGQAPCDFRVSGSAIVTNGLFTQAPTNGVAPPVIVTQPVGVFSQLAFETTNTLDMAYETYTNVIVNALYDNVITNGFYASTNAGTFTNIYAGFYEVNYSLSVLGDANVNGDEIEVEVFFDGVGDEHTSAHITVNATSGFFSLAKTHIKYLPAMTRIELKARNIADVDQDFDITRIVFIAKSP